MCSVQASDDEAEVRAFLERHEVTYRDVEGHINGVFTTGENEREVLIQIARLPRLEQYSTSANEITEWQLELLAKCRHLTSVSFSNATYRRRRIEDASPLRFLAQLSLLKDVWIAEFVGDADGVAKQMGQCESLTSLSLDSKNLTDRGAQCLARLTKLKTLELSRSGFSGYEIAGVGNLTNLTTLKLIGNIDLTDAALETISQLINLTHLDLTYCTSLSHSAFVLLAKLTQLEHLSLNSTHISDAGLSGLTTLHKLQSLDIADTAITRTGLKLLATLRSLKELHLSYLPTVGSLESLHQCRSLHTLIIINSELDAADFRALGQLKQLTELQLPGCKMTREQFIYLTEALSNCSIYETGWDFGPEGEAKPDDESDPSNPINLVELVGEDKLDDFVDDLWERMQENSRIQNDTSCDNDD